MIGRREFLVCLGARAVLARERVADCVIIGGGVGGCAAALAAARTGCRAILTEETDWIGGQLTQQAVPPDEHSWIEQFGCSRAYREYRNRIRAYYRTHYPLTGAAARLAELDPGNCSVSRICHEPRVGLAVLEAMLAPHVSSGAVTVLRDHQAISASTDGDRVESVRVRDSRTGLESDLTAAFFIDATELGDLLPLTGAEYVTGAESGKQTGELHAAPEPRPGNMQAITWCFVIDHVDGADHTIEKPAEYDFWRNYVPEMSPPWPGKQLDWAWKR